MNTTTIIDNLYQKYIVPHHHAQSDYFIVIKKLITLRNTHAVASDQYKLWQSAVDKVYESVQDELASNQSPPRSEVSFGTSGWRGILGKDIFVKSVVQVTQAIISLYTEAETTNDLAVALGVASLAAARRKGVVVGHDNRFGGILLTQAIVECLITNGFKVYHAGESSTGVLSASVLELKSAFSINLTPSHNPLEYTGIKFNGADGGPAAQIITKRITANARKIIQHSSEGTEPPAPAQAIFSPRTRGVIKQFDALQTWIDLVNKGKEQHGLNYDQIINDFTNSDDFVLAVDSMHGSSRIHLHSLFKNINPKNLLLLRNNDDHTFGGIAPEPSTANMQTITSILAARPEKLKLGVIIDPDADRIRFTDSITEIDMNFFGAMAYHYLHEHKKKKGLVAKTVATSNFVNSLAHSFQEEIFESRVGFKEFKPVIGKALVYFEESDGISVIGHTPEKDAYIGLLLALDMMLTTGKNLGEYLRELQQTYGSYYPARGGVEVSSCGQELQNTLGLLDKYQVGCEIIIGDKAQIIKEVIAIDGRKMILEDDSWLMIRASGTEPKVRFYVEARDTAGKETLLAAAKHMLREIGLL